jgi:hypothetical protein
MQQPLAKIERSADASKNSHVLYFFPSRYQSREQIHRAIGETKAREVAEKKIVIGHLW